MHDSRSDHDSSMKKNNSKNSIPGSNNDQVLLDKIYDL